MPEEKKDDVKAEGFSVVGEGGQWQEDPFEELLARIEETLIRARKTLDLASTLSKDAKNAQRAAKAMGKDFRSTRDLLGRLKRISGF